MRDAFRRIGQDLKRRRHVDAYVVAAMALVMHLELTRQLSERWYSYWVEQFDHIWRPAEPEPAAGDLSTREAQ